MYLFGHVGLTVAAVRAVDRETDLRLPILLSMLPDIIDKPVAVLMPAVVHWNSRNFGHTLLGAAAVLAILLANRRLANPLLLWSCYAGHLVLDRIWLNDGPAIFFWPFLGAFPRWSFDSPPTPYLFTYNIVGETIGLGILLSLARRHRLFGAPRWRAFVRTGRLAPADRGLA
ncbi:MAG: metal-dependent hydrolase [Elusimicrobiota bacterium]